MIRRIGFIALLATLCAVSAFSQSNAFADANVDYTFQIPDAKWKIVKTPASGGNVEFVFGDRNDGHLEVRRLSTPAATPMADVIRDQEDKLQFKPGYVSGKHENFNGKLNGSVFNFEFVQSGRPMSGRYYFLRSGDFIYMLRFTGFQDSIRSIRPQTDSIARTFEVKKS
ncbi:MAG: hypothetical protein ACJ72Z_00225 [Pyrinomonadaceae bacterium]